MTPLEGFGLVRHLRGRGFNESDVIACSLATQGTEGRRAYDFFRRRLMIPIRDAQGRLIAFGGRTLDPNDPAKYKNSRDSKLFDKSRTLFGFDRARQAIREKGRAIVVEGYMDALRLWQAGFPETVACLGTAFTEYHLQKLKQATSLVVLLFDGDSAGRRATLQTVNVALSAPEVHMKAVSLPQGMDPDDYVSEKGPQGLETLFQDSAHLLDFAVREKLRDVQPLAIPDLIQREFIPWLGKTTDLVQRDFLTVRIAQLTGVPIDAIKRDLPVRPGSGRSGSDHGAPTSSGRSGPDGSLRAKAALANDSQRVAAPLTPAAMDLLGHLYYAQPHEIDVTKVCREIEEHLSLDEIRLFLVREMGEILTHGHSPSAWPQEKWESTLAAENQQVLDKLRKASGAFVCTDRSVRIERSLAHIHDLHRKEIVSQLRAEAARLSRMPGHEEDLRQVLKSLTDIMRPTTPRT
jgi:DNA primase